VAIVPRNAQANAIRLGRDTLHVAEADADERLGDEGQKARGLGAVLAAGAGAGGTGYPRAQRARSLSAWAGMGRAGTADEPRISPTRTGTSRLELMTSVLLGRAAASAVRVFLDLGQSLID
jgi:hypothetical protein